MGYYSPQLQQNIAAHPQQKVAILKRILESKVVAEKARKEGFDKTCSIISLPPTIPSGLLSPFVTMRESVMDSRYGMSNAVAS